MEVVVPDDPKSWKCQKIIYCIYLTVYINTCSIDHKFSLIFSNFVCRFSKLKNTSQLLYLKKNLISNALIITSKNSLFCSALKTASNNW